MELTKNDLVRGWFGTAVVTDVAYGYVTTLGGLRETPDDDMVRVEFSDGSATYIYKEDVEEVLDKAS